MSSNTGPSATATSGGQGDDGDKRRPSRKRSTSADKATTPKVSRKKKTPATSKKSPKSRPRSSVAAAAASSASTPEPEPQAKSSRPKQKKKSKKSKRDTTDSEDTSSSSSSNSDEDDEPRRIPFVPDSMDELGRGVPFAILGVPIPPLPPMPKQTAPASPFRTPPRAQHPVLPDISMRPPPPPDRLRSTRDELRPVLFSPRVTHTTPEIPSILLRPTPVSIARRLDEEAIRDRFRAPAPATAAAASSSSPPGPERSLGAQEMFEPRYDVHTNMWHQIPVEPHRRYCIPIRIDISPTPPYTTPSEPRINTLQIEGPLNVTLDTSPATQRPLLLIAPARPSDASNTTPIPIYITYSTALGRETPQNIRNHDRVCFQPYAHCATCAAFTETSDRVAVPARIQEARYKTMPASWYCVMHISTQPPIATDTDPRLSSSSSPSSSALPIPEQKPSFTFTSSLQEVSVRLDQRSHFTFLDALSGAELRVTRDAMNNCVGCELQPVLRVPIPIGLQVTARNQSRISLANGALARLYASAVDNSYVLAETTVVQDFYAFTNVEDGVRGVNALDSARVFVHGGGSVALPEGAPGFVRVLYTPTTRTWFVESASHPDLMPYDRFASQAARRILGDSVNTTSDQLPAILQHDRHARSQRLQQLFQRGEQLARLFDALQPHADDPSDGFVNQLLLRTANTPAGDTRPHRVQNPAPKDQWRAAAGPRPADPDKLPKVDEADKTNACPICQVRRPDHFFVPCGHPAGCAACVHDMLDSPNDVQNKCFTASCNVTGIVYPRL